ncbi:non-structural maintenance of chromosomes element 3 homolog [Hyalella azteca]|uniref:Non-structural maintenance of chromosomes element 3 homolog n=1 Tax=Hyalella azteca TaxID=294128 RepID=A0A8B7P3A5_HYAAZ|nr:non-structural maintenance of chromosomes element 3 homolog [Hyalella azteca]XP_047737668.1 non-structural maintenance of chromosomes element 3 homolog [Hyalella azteca]XP_047737669.1 non-structural maintenance of chromosomes element 3 homolog [Hyalella azteca]XP_047737670.1 non-structural maintenance of chromosomes element 3 homolog [Hyalella azteca]
MLIETSSSEESSSEEEYVPRSTGQRSSSQGTSRGKGRLSQGSSQQASQTERGSISQASSSQASTDVSQAELARCAGLVANYFLAAECKKVPVKRSDLTKVVGKQHSRRLPVIVQQASSMLEKVFGYKIHELGQRKASYILLNKLAPPINCTTGPDSNTNDADDADQDRDQSALLGMADEPGNESDGLMFVILAVIFMMGGVVEEVTLLSFLKCLGVYVESADSHPVFGSCKKLLDDLVRQDFLEVLVQKDVEPPRKDYSWGERAHLQLCKRTLLQFVCKIYGGGMRPEDWTDHWSKIVSSTSGGGNSAESMDVDTS